MESPGDAFVRWQAVIREQLGAVTNLLLALGTGLLAFVANLLLDDDLASHGARAAGAVSVRLLFFSTATALVCAVNRLSDFRLTAQIARQRDEANPGAANLRDEVRTLGNRTWKLFYAQLWLFALGSASAGLSVLLEIY